MSLKVIFTNGNVVENVEGSIVSESVDGMLKLVLDKAGQTIAVIPLADYKNVMQ